MRYLHIYYNRIINYIQSMMDSLFLQIKLIIFKYQITFIKSISNSILLRNLPFFEVLFNFYRWSWNIYMLWRQNLFTLNIFSDSTINFTDFKPNVWIIRLKLHNRQWSFYLASDITTFLINLYSFHMRNYLISTILTINLTNG